MTDSINHDESFVAGIPMREIHTLLAEAAVRADAIRQGDPIDQMQVGLAHEIVTLYTQSNDCNPDPEHSGNASDDAIESR